MGTLTGGTGWNIWVAPLPYLPTATSILLPRGIIRHYPNLPEKDKLNIRMFACFGTRRPAYRAAHTKGRYRFFPLELNYAILCAGEGYSISFLFIGRSNDSIEDYLEIRPENEAIKSSTNRTK
jgi:hypothetical protein